MSQEDISVTPLDSLRADFAAKVAPARLFKRFPAAGKRLVGEYRVPEKAEARAAAEHQDDEYLLVSALVAIWASAPDHPSANKDGLVKLGEYVGKPEEDPLRFDHRLCDILGIPKGTPAQIALRLFDGNDLQLAEHAGEVTAWGLDTENEAYGDFPKG